MFNTQAAISTVFLTVMVVLVYVGSAFASYHRWTPARLVGGIVALAAFTGIVSHVAALIVGA